MQAPWRTANNALNGAVKEAKKLGSKKNAMRVGAIAAAVAAPVPTLAAACAMHVIKES